MAKKSKPKQLSDKKKPQKYDSSLKGWITQRAPDILPLLIPGVEYERTLDVEINRSMMRSDRVFQVHYHGKEYILHVEFEVGSDDELPSRLLVYNAVLYRDHHLPVITLVIYPFEVKMAVSPLIIPNSEHDIIIFRFHTLPLFSLEAQTYVEQHNTSMYPLLPTMRGVHADMISQVLSELSELYRDDEATLAQQFGWIQLLVDRTHTIEPLEKSIAKLNGRYMWLKSGMV